MNIYVKILLIVVGAVILVVAITAIVGAFLPRDHTATRSARFSKSPAEVFALVADFQNGKTWRTGLEKTEMLDPRGGKTCFREHTDFGPITYVVVTSIPGEKLVTKIDDPDLGFGGQWTFRLTPDGEGTRLEITEDGFVTNVMMRTMSRLFFSPTATMETYLADVGKKFGDSIVIK